MLMTEATRSYLGPPLGGFFLDLETVVAWTAVDAEGERESLRATFGLHPEFVPIAWLPADALPERPPAELLNEVAFGTPEAVDQVRGHASIGVDSSVSPNGEFVVLEAEDEEALAIWRRDLTRSRRLTRGASEPSWMPDNSGVIGVASRFADEPTASRLMLFESRLSRQVRTFDYQAFDPAGIGEDRERRYRTPVLSPTGSDVAFVVQDARAGRFDLHLVGIGRDSSVVTTWDVPHDALVDLAPVVTWVDRETLLVSHPVDWEAGLPRGVALVRVIVHDAGTIVEELGVLRGRGDDRGVALIELALSPDGQEMSYRLRHYRDPSVTRDVTDTIHVAATRDISQETLLARGDAGEGLTWLDDGRWLLGVLDWRLAALSVDTLDVEYLTDREMVAAFPLVVSSAEVWFAGNDGGGERVLRIIGE
jgi:hypothetical protein